MPYQMARARKHAVYVLPLNRPFSEVGVLIDATSTQEVLEEIIALLCRRRSLFIEPALGRVALAGFSSGNLLVTRFLQKNANTPFLNDVLKEVYNFDIPAARMPDFANAASAWLDAITVRFPSRSPADRRDLPDRCHAAKRLPERTMRRAAACVLFLSLLGNCNAPAPGASRPQTPAPSAAPRTPSPLRAVASNPVTVQACNRKDSASVFLVKSPAESRALSERLAREAVAVRYHDCQVELLAECDVGARGTITAAQSCCQTDMGCVGDDSVECDGEEERYWFGDEREWLLNLPEMASRLRAGSAAAVRARVRRAYHLETDALTRPSCAGATHLLVGARWGSLQIDEDVAIAAQPPQLTPLVRPSDEEQLVDVTLLAITELEPTSKLEPACMALLEPSDGPAPAAFLGRRRPPLPRRCSVARATARPEQLPALCEQWAIRSAHACAELSRLQQGEAAVDYAWRACQRARRGCERVVELLQAQARQADPRYQAALRLACTSGKHELCCAWGQQQLDVTSERDKALGVLSYYCAESVQACCRVLAKHGHAVPQRRQRPY